jgi:hypothetical protein
VKARDLLSPRYVLEHRDRIGPFLHGKAARLSQLIRLAYGALEIPFTLNDRHLLALKERHRGHRAFIIGNGPSLRTTDLGRLRGEITFAFNKIYLAFDQTDWRPTYYVAEDRLVLQQTYREIGALRSFTKLFPAKAKEWVPRFHDGIYFALAYEQFYPHLPRFVCHALKGLYWGSTVVYSALQLACFMGIREIYLIGVDFSFSRPTKAEKEGGTTVYTSEGERDHFHPEYRKPGEKWYAPNLHFQEKAFEAARLAMERRGGSVVNATRGGELEVLPRVGFDTLF